MRNSSTDPEQDYLSDGISEALVNRLSQVPELKVVANSSSSRFKGQDADPQVVAQALNVAGILAGRVSQRGDSLSISIELIDGRDRTQVWGEQYVRKTADLSQVSEDISRDVARKLQIGPAVGYSAERRHAPGTEPGSVRAAAQGTFPSREGRPGGQAESERVFARAVAADPGTRSPMPICPTSIGASPTVD